MQTPTLDHTEMPDPAACRCRPWSLCIRCYERLQASWAQFELQEWQTKLAPKPKLRLVNGKAS